MMKTNLLTIVCAAITLASCTPKETDNQSKNEMKTLEVTLTPP